MQHSRVSNTIATGFAMFSMFFGAGNVVFPLALGRFAQDNNFSAILGLLVTAVGVPFLGLIAMTLFDGNYKHFFERIGKIPGFIVAVVILGLIGPFGALPRCIALAYSTIEAYIPGISILVFTMFSCILIFLLTFRRNNIIEVLGYVLTPILLLALGVIIIKGFIGATPSPESEHRTLSVFLHGLKDGYQTMDLLGAFFFSSVVLVGLKQQASNLEDRSHHGLIKLTLRASCIGAVLLGLIYIGFSYVAAYHSEALENASSETLINAVAVHILGSYAGLIVCAGVSLACLTTAIALASVFAEFLHEDIFQCKLGYVNSLIITLIIAGYIATKNFMGIVAFLTPILQALYPALIVLCFSNIFYKLYDFQFVKIPFFLTLFLTIIAMIW